LVASPHTSSGSSRAAPTDPITLVIGNESADLDSLCSALLLAYFRSHTPPHYRLHVPLANLYRADLALRPELAAVLGHADLKPEDLLTLSDLPGQQSGTRVVLVDHNALTGTLRNDLGRESVVGCVDHHDDEGEVPVDCGDEPRIIRKCGSCMSLVVEHAKPVWEELAKTPEAAAWNAQLARVALGPVLTDTTKLQSKDKTTETDVWAVEFAEAMMHDGAGYDRDTYFREISDLKEDLSRLSHRDILRKDYKEWTDGGLTLGTSSVVQDVHYLLDKSGQDEFLTAVEDWATEKTLDLAAVLTTSHPDGKFARDLLIWAFGDKGVETAKAFVAKYEDKLELQPWEGGKLDDTDDQKKWRMCWKQGNLAASRKQIAPMLREAMRGNSE
jgi:exopolyphosphatase